MKLSRNDSLGDVFWIFLLCNNIQLLRGSAGYEAEETDREWLISYVLDSLINCFIINWLQPIEPQKIMRSASFLPDPLNLQKSVTHHIWGAEISKHFHIFAGGITEMNNCCWSIVSAPLKMCRFTCRLELEWEIRQWGQFAAVCPLGQDSCETHEHCGLDSVSNENTELLLILLETLEVLWGSPRSTLW